MDDDSDEKYRALRLQSNGKDAEKFLITAISQSPIKAACYAFKSRVKSDAKLIEKVRRKQIGKPDYDLDSIGDVVGLRLVTLFRKEMPGVVYSAVDFIQHKLKVSPNPFVKDLLSEIVIYSVNPAIDEIAMTIQSKLKENSIAAKIDLSKEGYSSIHILSRLLVQNENSKPGTTTETVSIEIQIRTVFEDAWGEIDHKFGYDVRQGKETGTPIRNPEMVQTHLKVLKKFTDACAEYADAIYDEASPEGTKPIGEGKIIPLGSDQEILMIFNNFGIDQDLIKRYTEGVVAREKAAKIFEEINREDGTRQLVDAAAYFRILSEETVKRKSGEKDYSIFSYYVSMEEALCLLTSNDKSLTQKALTIYSSLEETHKNFPLLKFRLGQTLGKLGFIDNAIAKFKEALENYNALRPKKGEKWPEELPNADYDHIKIALPKLLGYQLWEKSEQLSSQIEDEREEKAKLLRDAFETTRPLLTEAKDREFVLANNNMLYYGVAYLKLNTDKAEDAFIADVKKQVAASLIVLEKAIDIDTSDDLDQLDTLVHAYDFVGKSAQAVKAAKKVMFVAFNTKTTDHQHSQNVNEMNKFAWEIEQKHNGEKDG